MLFKPEFRLYSEKVILIDPYDIFKWLNKKINFLVIKQMQSIDTTSA